MDFNELFYADFFVAAIIYIMLFWFFWRKKGIKRIFLNTLLYIYITLVFMVTVMPVVENIKYIGTFEYRWMRLVPFDDYNCGRDQAVRQIILNTFMFMPFGFLLPLIRKHNFFSVTLLSFLFSVFIEVFQPLISSVRYSDITDVITNTLGGILGYLCYLLLMKIIKREKKNLTEPKA